MTNYRNPKYIERYEDVVFELDQTLGSPGNTQYQVRENNRIIVDNRGETTPLDWYNARFNVSFKLNKLADAGNIVATDGIVNSSFAFIKKMTVNMGGVDVYDCKEANHATNIKNLLTYSKGYSQSQGSNEFFYIDNNRNPVETEFEQIALDGNAQNIRPSRLDTYNKGFAARRAQLLNNAIVNTEIPLNRYSLFENLHDKLRINSFQVLELR